MPLGFIPELYVAKHPPSKFDIQSAKRLSEVVRKKSRVFRPYSLRKWASYFTKMRKVDRIDIVRIVEVLDWYLEHFGEKYVPEAYSAQSFRDKFLRIEKAMERAMDVKPKPPEIKVTKKARELAEFVDHLNWPKNSKNKLPEFAQVTYTGYKRFLDLLDTLPDKIHDQNWPIHERTALVRFLRWFSETHPVMHPSGFVLAWMRMVNHEVCRWKKWNGNLMLYAFDPNHSFGFDKFRNFDEDYPNMTDTLWSRFKEVLVQCW